MGVFTILFQVSRKGNRISYLLCTSCLGCSAALGER